MLSVMLTLMIISSLLVLTLKNYSSIETDYLSFMNDYLIKQVEALTNRQEVDVDGYDIFFNKKGHVNKAQTIDFNKHKVIVHLGNGYLFYE